MFAFIFIFVLLLGQPTTAQKARIRESKHRIGMGVWFTHLKTTYAIDDSFLHTFSINILPPINFGHHLPPCSSSNSANYEKICTVFSDYLNSLRNVSKTSTAYLYQLLQRINETIPDQPLKTGRTGRAWMPFLGQIASSALGLATESDVQAIRKPTNCGRRKSNK